MCNADGTCDVPPQFIDMPRQVAIFARDDQGNTHVFYDLGVLVQTMAPGLLLASDEAQTAEQAAMASGALHVLANIGESAEALTAQADIKDLLSMFGLADAHDPHTD
jgi:hypothetical protein